MNIERNRAGNQVDGHMDYTHDVPERKKFIETRAFEEMIEAKNFVFDQLKSINKIHEKDRRSVEELIELIELHNLDPPYICKYRRGNLKEYNNIYEIYDILEEFWDLLNKRKSLTEKINKLKTYKNFSYIEDAINEKPDKELFEYVEIYLRFLNEKFEELGDSEENLNDYSRCLGISYDDLARNLLDKNTDKTFAEGVNLDIGLFTDNLEDVIAEDLFYHPVIRNSLRIEYEKNVRVFTNPTEEGEEAINVMNLFYTVKHINRRKISDFTDESWLLVEKAASLGYLEVDFVLPWQEPASNFCEDEIFLNFKNNIFSDDDFESGIYPEVQRKLIDTFKNYMREDVYKGFESEIRAKLLSQSEAYVIEQSSQALKKILWTQPSLTNNNARPNIISLYIESKTSISCVYVDSDGFSDNKYETFKNLFNEWDERNNSEAFKCELRRLMNYIMNNKVEKVVVSANDNSCKELIKIIKGFLPDYIECFPVNCLVPKTISNLSREEGVNEALAYLISQARFVQDPMAEVLNLWEEAPEENNCLQLPLHPLQKFIENKLLHQRSFRKIIEEAVNLTGIDLNYIKGKLHLQKPVQFLAGLGPKSAKRIINFIESNDGDLRYREILFKKNIVGKKVYENCAGFIKLRKVHDKEDRILEGEGVLEHSRTHPAHYDYAYSIAKEAVRNNKITKQEALSKLIDNLHLLKNVNMESLAETISKNKKQNNVLQLLNDIKEELCEPFKDPRDVPNKLTDEELFYSVLNITPDKLRVGSYVACTVKGDELIAGRKKPVIHHIETDLLISLTNDNEEFRVGDTIYCIIKKIIPKEERIVASTSLGDLKTIIKEYFFKNKNKLSWESFWSTFQMNEFQDFPHIKNLEKKKRDNEYEPLDISATNFFNISRSDALLQLEQKEIGDFIFRPGAKRTDPIELSWKIQRDIIVEFVLSPNSVYEPELSITEIIQEIIYHINNKAEEIINHSRFSNGGRDYLIDLIEEEIDDDQTVFWIGWHKENPLEVSLFYKYDEKTEIEQIKIFPECFYFHELKFEGFSDVIRYFKENHTKQAYNISKKNAQYQTFESKFFVLLFEKTKESKTVQQEQLNIKVKKEILPGDIRVKQENSNFNIKSELKMEGLANSVVCNFCGGPGHNANQCTNPVDFFVNNKNLNKNQAHNFNGLKEKRKQLAASTIIILPSKKEEIGYRLNMSERLKKGPNQNDDQFFEDDHRYHSSDYYTNNHKIHQHMDYDYNHNPQRVHNDPKSRPYKIKNKSRSRSASRSKERRRVKNQFVTNIFDRIKKAIKFDGNKSKGGYFYSDYFNDRRSGNNAVQYPPMNLKKKKMLDEDIDDYFKSNNR